MENSPAVEESDSFDGSLTVSGGVCFIEFVDPPVPDEGPLRAGLDQVLNGDPSTDDGQVPQSEPPADDDLHSYVTGQRKKLRVLMEEFEPQQSFEEEAPVDVEATDAAIVDEVAEVSEMEEAQEAELREAVTAAVIDGSSQLGEVTGARRSRDEAIRQLDDLIRVAADESVTDISMPPSSSRPGDNGDHTSGTDSISGIDTVSEGETVWDGAHAGTVEVDFEGGTEEETVGEVDPETTEKSIEATLDFATEQLDSLSEETADELVLVDEPVAEEPLVEESAETADSELELETGSTGLLAESTLTAEDAVDEAAEPELRQSFAWDAGELDQSAENESADSTEPTDSSAESSTDPVEDTWREDESPQSAESLGTEFTADESAAEVGNDLTGEGTSTDDGPDAGGLDTASMEDTEDGQSEERVQELRAQLAQMFDIPKNGSESVTASGTSSLSEGSSAGTDFWSSPVLDDESVDTAESALDLPDVASDSDAASDSESGEPTHDEDSQPEQNQPVSANGETGEAAASPDPATLDASDPNSISAYMEQLLARNRKQSAGEPVEYKPEPVRTPRPETSTTTGLSSDQYLSSSTSPETSLVETAPDRSWLTEGPKHKQDRDAVRASLTTMREVANESARSAVAQASRTQLRKEILTLTAASLICLIFAVASTVLKINPLLPLGAVGLSLYFAVKLGIEMRRSWKLMGHVKQAVESSSSESGEALTPVEVISQDAAGEQ